MFFFIIKTVIFILVAIGSVDLDETRATVGVYFLLMSLEDDFDTFDKEAIVLGQAFPQLLAEVSLQRQSLTVTR